ncbi:holin [Escherichia coli]|uniref:holin n=1 Tax=Escherichia coli TaxID=562 RepID=UPI003CF87AD9
MTAEEKSVLSLFMIGVLIVVGKVLAGGEPITPRLFIGRMLLGGFVSMVAGVVLVQFSSHGIRSPVPPPPRMPPPVRWVCVPESTRSRAGIKRCPTSG